ncbi:MEDS domain-containing protein [Actinoplanes sp. NPDC051633]|uniref:MEDS domain-containing protein n=1 Tax=Actinoplanes sp. NPDC051633 TaxID=3155670 RepID=UPI00342AD0BA
MSEDFTHSAFLYDSLEAYVGFLVPFICEGLERDEAVAMVAPAAHIKPVREQLGTDAAAVRFRAGEEWEVRPIRTIGVWAQVLRTTSAAGRPSTRIIHEINAEDQTPSWVRAESAINAALAGQNAHLLCPQRKGTRVDAARRTHKIFFDRGWHVSDDYEDPAVLLGEVPEPVFPAPGDPIVAAPLGDSVADLRAHLRNRATAERWLPPDRIEVLVLALSELGSNSIRHGGADRELRVWLSPEAVVCEVIDDGPQPPGPLAGYLPPVPGVVGGMGLWLVGQICDALSVHTEKGVTHARFALYR